MQFKKKVIAGALAAGLVMGAGGIAAAYFDAGGSGTGTAKVGHAAPLSVTQSAVYYLDGTSNSVTALYPTGLAQPVFQIKNTNHFPEHATWNLADFSIVTSGTTIAATKTGTNPVAGCSASWFTLTANGTSTGARTLKAGAPGDTPTPATSTHVFASVDLNMKTSGTTQLACATKTPIVKLTLSS
jgi:hypothetical protein